MNVSCKRCALVFYAYAKQPQTFCSMACKMAYLQDPVNIRARFWAAVNKTERCWLYTGAIDTEGYGRFSYGPMGPGRKQFQAHRYSWLLAGGELPKWPKMLCHTCDVRNCVNPEHIYIGDHDTNTKDRLDRQRDKRLLTPEVVRAIRAEPKEVSHAELSKKYGAGAGVICQIRRGQKYRHVQ